MKTLRLTKLESIAYANGERRFWREMRKQPRTLGPWTAMPSECPYGKPGDRIELTMRDCPGAVHATITSVKVEQRGGRWGWIVEVGA